MIIGVRGHDIVANTGEELCEALGVLGVSEVQLVAHKSFSNFVYSNENIQTLSDIFKQYGIHVAVFGCYIDPMTEEGQKRFHDHIRYAQILNAGCIATETAIGVTKTQIDEARNKALVSLFRQFSDDAAAHGIRCAVETVWGHPICSPETTERLIADVGSDNLYAILDPVNLMENEADSKRGEKVQRAIELYGDRILAIHWKDIDANSCDPALAFAKGNDKVTVITEGIRDEALKNTVKKLKEIERER